MRSHGRLLRSIALGLWIAAGCHGPEPEAAAPEATGRASSGRVSVRATATGCATAGGTTRSTCPTSITFGLSIPFQRATSRQFWPLSRPMRISVSPGFTV